METLIENKKRYELLSEEFMKLNYGDILKHEDIAQIIQSDYPSRDYQVQVGLALKHLWKKYQRKVKNVRKVGYRVIVPDEYTNETLNCYLSGVQKIKEGTDIMNYAPVNSMTQEGREAYRRVQDKALAFNASVQGSIVELKLLGKKEHPFNGMIKEVN